MITIKYLLISILFICLWMLWGTLMVWLMEDLICGYRGYFEKFCLARFLKRLFGAVFWPLWIFIGWFCYN